MNNWKKDCKTAVDQRNVRLPPTWCPRGASATPTATSEAGIYRTESSGALAKALVEAIDAAREVVMVCSFLLADKALEDALLRAAQRGVRVYLLIASEAKLDREVREDSGFDKRTLAEHKQTLELLAGWALIRSAPDFHAKTVLVDPLGGGPGFLLTANLTTEALARNEELGVRLTYEETRVIREHLAWAMWEGAEHELLEPGRLSAVRGPLGRLRKPAATGNVVATVRERGSLAAAVLGLVRGASEALLVACYGWDADHDVVAELCRRAREGVSVTVLARARSAAMPALLALAAAGARVLGFEYLHAKAVVADGRDGLVMTGNLQRHGLDESFDLGVRLAGDRADALHTLLTGWTECAAWELQLAPALGGVHGAGLVWTNKRLLPYSVVAHDELRLPARAAESADRMELTLAAPAGPEGLPQPAHELTLTCEVNAPRLARNAKRLGHDGEGSAGPRLFREPTGRVVVAISNADHMARAQQLARERDAAAIVVLEA